MFCMVKKKINAAVICRFSTKVPLNRVNTDLEGLNTYYVI